jgi:hypothetical protein
LEGVGQQGHGATNDHDNQLQIGSCREPEADLYARLAAALASRGYRWVVRVMGVRHEQSMEDSSELCWMPVVVFLGMPMVMTVTVLLGMIMSG